MSLPLVSMRTSVLLAASMRPEMSWEAPVPYTKAPPPKTSALVATRPGVLASVTLSTSRPPLRVTVPVPSPWAVLRLRAPSMMVVPPEKVLAPVFSMVSSPVPRLTSSVAPVPSTMAPSPEKR